MELVVSWRQAPLPSLAEPAVALAVLVLVVTIAVCVSRKPSTGRVVAGVLAVAVVLIRSSTVRCRSGRRR